MSIAELAAIERVYGTRLQLPADVRTRVDAYRDQPVQLLLPKGGS